jgi:glycosyltransferase involved in cell wall biosynthesis
MNIIFLTLVRLTDIEKHGIYEDLMRKFRDEGHRVYIVCPVERRLGEETTLTEISGVKMLYVKTLNIQKTNVVEKGLGTLLIERQFIKAIKKHLSGVSFDLITYSTPPITFTNVVRYLKKQNPQAISYLQLKDIFPQNAVDIGMLVASPKPSPQRKGLKNTVMALPKYLLYKYFRKKEVALYKNSDYIGCMSPANVEFVLKNNPEIDATRVEVAPNSIDLDVDDNLDADFNEGNAIRIKYGLPIDKPIFIYGGNLGKPQGIDYLVKCLDANKNRKDCYFVVVGSGTEYPRLEAWYDLNLNDNLNVKVMKGLPKEDYDMLVRSCDVGLIFLDYRFTIPNYPSRLLSYLENKMPVLCATDVNTDIGKIAEENGYGYWCESVKPEDFTKLVDKMLKADRKAMGEHGYDFLKQNYLVEHTYNVIMRHLKP